MAKMEDSIEGREAHFRVVVACDQAMRRGGV